MLRQTSVRGHRVASAVIVASVVMSAACTHSEVPPTSLVVTRIDRTPGSVVTERRWTFGSSEDVRALWARILALPKPEGEGVAACTAEFYVTYRLAFYRGRSIALIATVHPTGCPLVLIRPEDVRVGTSVLPVLQHMLQLSDQEFGGYPPP
jgi:hypothetical protein